MESIPPLLKKENTVPLFIDNVIDQYAIHRKSKTWYDKPNWYWAWRLVREVIELLLSLIGLRRTSVEWELMRIASTCMNWGHWRAIQEGETMSRNGKIVMKHLLGLSICLGLATTHLMVWNFNHGAWGFCLIGALAVGALAMFIKHR